MEESELVTLEERKSILDEEVLRLIREGWIVESRTDTTCLLVKEDNVMGWFSIFASLFASFPFFEKRIKTRIIEVTSEGSIKRSWTIV